MLKQVTHGRNGYPLFHGVTEHAFFGFNNFEEAQTLAKLTNGTIQQIHFRDGWQLCELKGEVYEPFKNSAEDYGETYSEWHPDSEYEFLTSILDEEFGIEIPKPVQKANADIDFIASLKQIRDVLNPLFTEDDPCEKLIDIFEECLLEYIRKPENTEILTHEGMYFETMQKTSMHFCFDTHNKYIAVVINSGDFADDDD